MVRPVQYIQVNQYDTLTQIQEKKVIYQYTCRKHLAENIGNIHLKCKMKIEGIKLIMIIVIY